MRSGFNLCDSAGRDFDLPNCTGERGLRRAAGSVVPSDEIRPPDEVVPPNVADREFRHLVLGWDIGLHRRNEDPGQVTSQPPIDRFQIGLVFGPRVTVLSWRCPSGENCESRLIGPQVYVVPPGSAHATCAATRAESFVVAVTASLWQRMTNRNVAEVLLVEAAQHDMLVWTSAGILRHLSGRSHKASAALVDLIGGSLVCRLGELLSEPQGQSSPACRMLTADQRRRVLEFMQRNLKHDIHVDDLAKQTGHCAAHFSELFTQTMSCSPFRFLKELRMRTAHDLLANGGVSVREAAQAVGYLSFEHFGEVFRSFWGVSPREFVRQLRDRVRESPRPNPRIAGKFLGEAMSASVKPNSPVRITVTEANQELSL